MNSRVEIAAKAALAAADLDVRMAEPPLGADLTPIPDEVVLRQRIHAELRVGPNSEALRSYHCHQWHDFPHAHIEAPFQARFVDGKGGRPGVSIGGGNGRAGGLRGRPDSRRRVRCCAAQVHRCREPVRDGRSPRWPRRA